MVNSKSHRKLIDIPEGIMPVLAFKAAQAKMNLKNYIEYLCRRDAERISITENQPSDSITGNAPEEHPCG